MIPPSDSLIPLLGANPPQKMKNIISEPVLSLTTTIVLFLLSFTGSIFLWFLSYPYGNAHNLQFGHLLSTDEARADAVRNLIIASIFYAILAVLMVYQLILHLKQSHRQSWDPSIAMVNVHTPKLGNPEEIERKRHTPNLSTSTVSGVGVVSDAASRYRGGGPSTLETK